MDSDSKIFVAGHNGLVGSAIVRNLEAKGFTNIITMDRAKLDLTKLHDVQIFFAVEQPEYVFLAAAKVWVVLVQMLSILLISYMKI